MPITQAGTLNTTALVVPDLYVQIVPPQQLVLNGVPTNLVGVVGTAAWGPVNQPAIVGTMQDYARLYGAIQPRQYDMGTQVATAVQQGASNFRCVRVTDGTDTAATYALFYANGAYPLLLAARYTGSLGNQIALTLSQLSNGGWRLTLGLPGQVAEVFDVAAGTAPQVWAALAQGVNAGTGALRGPSQLCVASVGAGTSTALATLAAQQLLGGTDGATTITAATLVGVDGLPRTGMYALRGQGCSIGVLADTYDPTSWTIQARFGESEGCYMILAGPPGDTIPNAVATKQSAGLVSYAAKLMFGDWIYWNDPTTGTVRLVSPQGFVAGRLANLSPEQSSLNKPLYAVLGSQRSGGPTAQSSGYSSAELSALIGAGLDVIANPQPGGAFWGVRAGHNASLSPATNGDNYTRLTDYIAATLAAGMGQFVGQVINASLFQNIQATQMSFLQGLLQQGVLGSTDGTLPFNVVCDTSNNPATRTALGYVQSDAQVRYQAINEKFIVNVEGGTTVTVARQALPTASA